MTGADARRRTRAVRRDVRGTSMQCPDFTVPQQSRERVLRPNGTTWVHDVRSGGRKVYLEHAADGPVVVVACTHDLDKAADMASVRWGAHHPDVAMPVGERQWRRRALETWPGQRTVRQAAIEHSTGHESRSFPVVVFAAPKEASA